MKKIITHILVTILSLQLITAVATTHAASESGHTITHDTRVLIAADNTLIIPKPNALPGAKEATQGESGGIKAWITETVLPTWTKGLVGFVASLSFVMLVVSGIKYLTAYGNEEAATSAKKMIIYSILALLLAMFSYTIVSIIVRIQIG
jgi:hypothetical protein